MSRDALIAKTLPQHRGWLLSMARSMLDVRHPAVEDLAQEGYIAMWRATETFDDTRDVPLSVWLQMSARRRMLDVVTRRERLTGAPEPTDRTYAQPRGRASRDRIRAHLAAHPRATGAEIARATGMSPSTVSTHLKRMHLDDPEPRVNSLDALTDAGFDLASADDVVQHIIEGYHHGVIAEAMASLTPNERRYVAMRFWEGMTTGEMTAVFGYNPGAIWTTARERLRPLLADLVAA